MAERSPPKTHSTLISGTIQKPISVLVVEEATDGRSIIAPLLAAHGFLVRSVRTTQTARIAATDRAPDVMIADLQLGSGAPGWTLARTLRGDPRTAHVGLIAISERDEPTQRVVGAFDVYLRKPMDIAVLCDVVKQLGQVSRAARSAERGSQSGSSGHRGG